MPSISEVFRDLPEQKLDAQLNYLEKFEYHKTVAEFKALRGRFQSGTDIETILPLLRDFFVARWERIRGTDFAYPHAPTSPANRFCLEVAKRIQSHCPGERISVSPNALLMPTITMPESTVREYKGDHFNDFDLDQFILTDDDQHYVPVLKALSNNDLESKLHNDGIGVSLQKPIVHSGGEPLFENELSRLYNHSQAAKDYCHQMKAERVGGNRIYDRIRETLQQAMQGGDYLIVTASYGAEGENKLKGGMIRKADIPLLASVIEHPQDIETWINVFDYAGQGLAAFVKALDFSKIKKFFRDRQNTNIHLAKIWVYLSPEQRTKLIDDLELANQGVYLIDILGLISDESKLQCFRDAFNSLEVAMEKNKSSLGQSFSPLTHVGLANELSKLSRNLPNGHDKLPLLTELTHRAAYALTFPTLQANERDHNLAMERARANLQRIFNIARELQRNTWGRKLGGCVLIFCAMVAISLAITGLILTAGGTVAISTLVSIKAGNIIMGVLGAFGIIAGPIGSCYRTKSKYAAIGGNTSAFFSTQNAELGKKRWVAQANLDPRQSLNSDAGDVLDDHRYDGGDVSADTDKLLAEPANGATDDAHAPRRMGMGSFNVDSK